MDCNNGDGIPVFDQPVPIVIDATVNQDMNVLTANSAGLSYQWVDCDNGNAEILGANDQSFIAETSGNYAVMITNSDCTVMSECFPVTVVGLGETERMEFSYFQNPVEDVLTVELNKEYGNVIVRIHSLSGSLVLEENPVANDRILLDCSDLESGFYVVTIITDKGMNNAPLVIR